MAKKKYPCGMAKSGVCEFAGNRQFNYGFTMGRGAYCNHHTQKRFVWAINTCPLEAQLTKHAPDVVESSASSDILPASEVPASEAESTPATTQAM